MPDQAYRLIVWWTGILNLNALIDITLSSYFRLFSKRHVSFQGFLQSYFQLRLMNYQVFWLVLFFNTKYLFWFCHFRFLLHKFWEKIGIGSRKLIFLENITTNYKNRFWSRQDWICSFKNYQISPINARRMRYFM